MSIKTIKRILIPISLVVLIAVLTTATKAQVYAASASFIVTNTNDSGAGSLRQAIIDANANNNTGDIDNIQFNIAGSGLKTITLNTILPTIDEPININGFTQPGSSANTAVNPLPFNANYGIAVHAVAGSDFRIFDLASGSNGSTIKGLVINECGTDMDTTSCIRVGSDNVTIAGNYIGVNPDGMSLYSGNNVGAVNHYAGNNLVVGGTNAEDRNIVGNNQLGSFSIGLNGDTASVKGNYIGLASNGVATLGSAGGISTAATSEVMIGGVGSANTNVISGGQMGNVLLGNKNAIVQNNYIGTDYLGKPSENVFNPVTGVVFNNDGAGHNLVGGTQSGQGNIIAGTNGAGVVVLRTEITPYNIDWTPTGNTILGNSIYNTNLGNTLFNGAKLGIGFAHTIDTSGDFQPEQVNILNSANDTGDVDTGVNGLINFPELTSVSNNGNQLAITYSLDAADSPSNQYRVEFFASDVTEVGSDGSGMGQYFLGAVNTTNGVDLNAIITVPDGLDITNKKISATTTAIDSSSSSGFGSTSVFSQPVEIAQENTPPVTPPSSNTANLTTPTSPISAFSLKPVSISTPTGTNISSSSTVPESSLVTQDNDNQYPLGLVNFSFTTNQSSNQVSLSFITNLKPNQVTPKKYNPSTNTYINLPASSNPTITETTINNQHALVLTYTLIDNGELDLNPTAGTISDPVGLAVSNSTYDQLADTGENTQPILLTAVLLLVSGIVGVWYFGKGRVK